MTDLKGKKIGVTGSNGFIGSHLCRELEKKYTSSAVIPFKGNMCNLNEVFWFVNGCGEIYHLAGKNREEETGVILKNNVVSTSNLVYAVLCKKPEMHVSFVSSSQVEYFSSDGLSEYTLAKRIEENIIRKLKRYNILRAPNIYGPGARPYYNSVVATFCTQVAKNEKLTIHNPNSLVRLLYVENFVKFMLEADHTFNMIYNKVFERIGLENLTVGEIASFLTDRLGEHKNLQKTLEYYIEKERRKNANSPYP